MSNSFGENSVAPNPAKKATDSRKRKGRKSPFSIRLTDAERAFLLEKAGGLPLGAYVKQVILADNTKPRAIRRTVADAGALGQILGLLGQSRIANNLNQLAKAAHLGALPVEKEVESDLKQACENVALMRTLLLQALGLNSDWIGDRQIALWARIAAGRSL